MRKFTRAIISLVVREDGPTAVEYAVVLALIVVVCLAAVAYLGVTASDIYTGAGAAADSAP
jgi:pilus assembly protein Flp/PilA